MAFRKNDSPTHTGEESDQTAVVQAAKSEVAVNFGSAEELMRQLYDGQAQAIAVMNDQLVERSGGVLFPVMHMDEAGNFNDPYGGVEGVEYPTGRKGFPAIVLSWRYTCVLWPEVFKQGQGNAKPKYAGCVPGNSPRDVALAVGSATAIQMTKAAERADKFDPPNGPGAPATGMELLLYVPEVDHLMVVEVPAKYQNIIETKNTLDDLVNENGVVPPVPFHVKPNFRKDQINGFNSKVYWLSFSAYTGNPAEVMAQFAAYMRGLGEEQLNTVRRWLACEDRPVSTAHRQAMQDAIDINPPRR